MTESLETDVQFNRGRIVRYGDMYSELLMHVDRDSADFSSLKDLDRISLSCHLGQRKGTTSLKFHRFWELLDDRYQALWVDKHRAEKLEKIKREIDRSPERAKKLVGDLIEEFEEKSS